MNITTENIRAAIIDADILTHDEINNLQVDIPLSQQGCDSLDLVNVYMILEEKFAIKIPDSDLNQLLTINNIVDYLNARIN